MCQRTVKKKSGLIYNADCQMSFCLCVRNLDHLNTTIYYLFFIFYFLCNFITVFFVCKQERQSTGGGTEECGQADH
jgi:hypothetical protein